MTGSISRGIVFSHTLPPIVASKDDDDHDSLSLTPRSRSDSDASTGPLVTAVKRTTSLRQKVLTKTALPPAIDPIQVQRIDRVVVETRKPMLDLEEILQDAIGKPQSPTHSPLWRLKSTLDMHGYTHGAPLAAQLSKTLQINEDQVHHFFWCYFITGEDIRVVYPIQNITEEYDPVIPAMTSVLKSTVEKEKFWKEFLSHYHRLKVSPGHHEMFIISLARVDLQSTLAHLEQIVELMGSDYCTEEERALICFNFRRDLPGELEAI